MHDKVACITIDTGLFLSKTDRVLNILSIYHTPRNHWVRNQSEVVEWLDILWLRAQSELTTAEIYLRSILPIDVIAISSLKIDRQGNIVSVDRAKVDFVGPWNLRRCRLCDIISLGATLASAVRGTDITLENIIRSIGSVNNREVLGRWDAEVELSLCHASCSVLAHVDHVWGGGNTF